jgi:hypothetical protein
VKSRSKAVPGARTVKGNARSGVAAAQQTCEALAVELYSLLNRALGEFGLTNLQKKKAIKQAWRVKATPSVSGPMLRDFAGLGTVLTEWSRSAAYLDSEGKPRVLPIQGSGATFETLARRFLPKKPLRDVVAMACEVSEVVTRPGDRIALLGSVFVNHVKSPERSLAFATRQVDQLLQTTLHNLMSHRKGQIPVRMQRTVSGIIARSEFEGFMRELRPQIYDLLLRADASFERRQPDSRRSLRNAAWVSIGLYVAQEHDLERAGADVCLVTKHKAAPAEKEL